MDWSEYSVHLGIVTLGLLVVLIVIFYMYGTATYGYWKGLGIASVQPKYPFFGNFHEAVFSLKPNHEIYSSLYYAFKGKTFGGIYKLRKPTILVTDPDLVLKILIGDFGNFTNRLGRSDRELDHLSKSIIFMEWEKWKSIRSKLNPIFSSANLRHTHQQLLHSSDRLVNFLEKFAEEPFNVREVITRFGVEVFSSFAFGITSDVLNESDSPFKKLASKLFESSFLSKFRQSIVFDYPWIVRFLSWKRIPKEMELFFSNVINNTLEYREKNKILREDILHLLNEMKKNYVLNLENGTSIKGDEQVIMDEKLMLANCITFYGFGTHSTFRTLSYTIFELALNQDIQTKLCNEIVTVLKKYDNELTYSSTKEMTYMTQVLNETMRMNISTTLVRVTKAPYKLPGSSVVIPKGTPVEIPLHAFHHDPEYFPEPDKFLPERFSEKNIGSIKKGAFIPFSAGPRICLGMQLAFLMIKVTLTKLLLKYKLNLSKKMKIPLKFDSTSFFMDPVGELWIELEERNLL